MHRLLLLCCFLLFIRQAHAQQTTISGRVLELKKNLGIPGVTILQTGTTNGVSSDADGLFTFTVPGKLDSISLTVSFIGYVRQQLRVAASSNATIRLAVDVRTIECDLVPQPIISLGLASGIRYAPYGGTLKLYGSRLLKLPITAEASYQTNFDRNYALTARLQLPTLLRRSRLSVTETLNYQQLRARPANVYFNSFSGTIGVGVYHIGSIRVPDLLLGAGYARYRPLQAADLLPWAGYGYSFGLRRHFGYPYLYTWVQATRWPGYWQWQGHIAHSFGLSLEASLEVNHFRQYSEVCLSLSRIFY